MSWQERDWARQGYAPRGRSLTPVVKGLIIANVCVFVLQFLSGGNRGQSMEALFGLSPYMFFRKFHVWQIVTYMFLHSRAGIFHIVFNMLFLYWFGPAIELMFGSKRFLRFYLLGGIVAGFAYCLFSPRLTAPVIGASGAIMALVVVYAIHFPDQQILFFFIIPMKIRHFVFFIIAMDLFYSVQYISNGVANVAHLGGAAFGFAYVKFASVWTGLGDSMRRSMSRRVQNTEEDDREKVDAILEKISREGMDKLTRRERQFLLRQSQKYRKRQKP